MGTLSQEPLEFVPAVEFTNRNPSGHAQVFGAITVKGNDAPVFVLLAPSKWNAGELQKIVDRMVAAVGSEEGT